MAEASFERVMAERHPEIPWRAPVKVTVGQLTRYCCRICIARQGLKGSEIEQRGYETLWDCHLHILRQHGAAS